MPAPEIAVAYVSIVPEIQGLARQLRQQLISPARDAGEDAGEQAGNAFRRALERQSAGSALGNLVATAGAAARAQAVSSGAVVGAAFANSFVSAGAGVGALVAAVKPQFAQITKASDAYTKSQDAQAVAEQKSAAARRLAANGGKAYEQALKDAEAATKTAKDAQEAYRLSMSGMPVATQQTARAFIGLKDDFGAWSDSLSGTTMPLFTQGINALRRSIPALTPLVRSSVDVLRDFAGSLGEGQTGEVFRQFGANIRTNAAGSLRTFLQVGKDVATGIAGIFNGFAPLTENLNGGLTRLTAKFAAFGANLPKTEGFQNFLRQARESIPSIVTLVGNLAATSAHLFQAMAGLGPLALGVFGLIARVLAALPVPVIQALIVAFTAWKLAIIANTVATRIHTLWVNRMTLATIRERIATVASAIAQRGARIAILATAAAQRVLNVALRMNPIGLVITALVALGAGLVWAYKKSETFRAIVQAAWRGIQVAALYAWHNVLKPTFTALGIIVRWLYANIIKPVFRHIVAAIRVWWVAMKMYFRLAMSVFRSLAAVAKWLYATSIKPVFTNIARVAKWLWNNGLKPAFSAIKAGVRAVGSAFNTAKNYIGKQWSKLSSIARKPISFIINTVYNKGIVGVWNKVASAFGAPKLKTFRFASGGIMPGYTPGRDPHKFYSPTGGALELSGGEAIMRPEVTRALGVGTINRLNGAARAGGVSGVRSAMGTQAFANGGIYGAPQRFANGGVWGWIKNASSAAWDKIKAGASWLKDGIKSSAMAGMNRLVKPLINKISGSAGLYSKMVKGIPSKMLKAVFDFSGAADKKMAAAGVGGKGTKSALRWARTQNGKRYQWGGNGNPSWDCSGFTSAIESVIRGQRPHRRWSTHAFKGGAPPGWVRGMRSPYMVGITHSGVGHVAGTLNGVNVESRGGDGVVVGSRARGARSSLFSSVYGFAPARKYDAGGWLQPGATMSVNATGKPEPILTASQWSTMATLASKGATGGLQNGDRLVLVTDGGSFEAYVDARASKRIGDELTTPATLGRTM